MPGVTLTSSYRLWPFERGHNIPTGRLYIQVPANQELTRKIKGFSAGRRVWPRPTPDVHHLMSIA
jgi:hypothetical protein